MDAGLRASWDAVREGLADGAAEADVPTLVASTLPELLQDASAAAFLERDIAAVAGLRTAVACAAALGRRPGDPARLRAIAAAAAAAESRRRVARRGRGQGAAARGRHPRSGRPRGRRRGGRRRRCARAGRPGRDQSVVGGAAAQERGGSSRARRRRRRADAVRTAYRRVVEAGRRAVGPGSTGPDVSVLVEAMAPPGVELLVAARRDAVVPRSWSASAASGPSCSTTSRSSRCPPRRRASRRRCAALRGFGVLAGARGSRAGRHRARSRARRGSGRSAARRGAHAARAQPGHRPAGRRRRARRGRAAIARRTAGIEGAGSGAAHALLRFSVG